jgi:hypothetical protein
MAEAGATLPLGPARVICYDCVLFGVTAMRVYLILTLTAILSFWTVGVALARLAGGPV